MKKAHVLIFLACVSAWLCSCNKLNIGDIVEETRRIDESFQVVEICDDIDVSLRHCTADTAAGTLLVSTGENLIEGINATTTTHSEVTGSDSLVFTKLVITNENTYNNLRPHSHAPQMTIYYDSLLKIIFYSNAQNVRTDTLRGYNFPTQFSHDTNTWDSLAPNLMIEVKGGSGNFNVLANCYKLMVKSTHGTSNLFIKGKTSLASTYADYDCHGIIDCKGLYSHIHYITTYGTNMVKAQSYYLLDVKNRHIGEVHYLWYRTTEEEHVWNDTLHQYDTVIKPVFCPRNIRYNGEYVSFWNYNNDIPGLVKDLE